MSNLPELRTRLHGDGGEPGCVIRHGQKIRALCLRKDLNPKMSFGSVEVWFATDAPAVEWGQRLSAEKMALPVFTTDKEDGDYQCLGHYYVQPRQHTPQELAAAEEQASHPLSRIVFLDRAYVSEIVFR